MRLIPDLFIATNTYNTQKKGPNKNHKRDQQMTFVNYFSYLNCILTVINSLWSKYMIFNHFISFSFVNNSQFIKKMCQMMPYALCMAQKASRLHTKSCLKLTMYSIHSHD